MKHRDILIGNDKDEMLALQYVKFLNRTTPFNSKSGEFGYLILIGDIVYFFGNGDDGRWLKKFAAAIALDGASIMLGKIPQQTLKTATRFIDATMIQGDRGTGGRYSLLLASITDVKLNLEDGDHILHIYTRRNIDYNFIVYSEKNFLLWRQALLGQLQAPPC